MSENLIVKNVDLFGDSVMVARKENGDIYAGVSYICRSLGMTKGQKDRQISNIQKDNTLKRGCLNFEAGVFDANNETVALRIDFIPLWLAKINVTDITIRENPDLAEKLLNYQLKAKDILADAFQGNRNLPMTTEGQIKLLAQGHGELKEEIREVKSELDKFKEELPLLPVEMQEITEAVHKKGVSVMGGKKSPAYHDRSISQSVYRDIYNEIHRNFGCFTYKAIPRKYLSKVLDVVEKYALPVVLSDRISDANNQLSFM